MKSQKQKFLSSRKGTGLRGQPVMPVKSLRVAQPKAHKGKMPC